MKRQTVIVRLWVDQAYILQGQVSDPHSAWRRPFHDAEELWQALMEIAAQPPAPPPHPPPDDEI